MSPPMAGLLSIDEAQRRILGQARPLPPERVPLERAAGRVLAEPALARIDLPPFASSAMDGFALRSADTPGTLPVVERIPAGRPATRALGAGETMAIATGGEVPEGADAVIPLEYVVDHDNTIDVDSAVEPGANVRPRGGDVRAGEPMVPAGVRVEPAHVGALAAAGVTELVSARVPRAAVLATGSELRRPGEPLGPGEIYEANSFLLEAALVRAGAAVDRLPVAADDEDAHRTAIARGLASDLLITTGGVSVGPHDLVRRIESELGVEEVFWGVAVKPGKPIAFGVRDGTLVFGLPGNPVSALVGFELFVRPALRALQGATSPLPAFLPGRLGAEIRRNSTRDELVRARSRVEEDEVVLEALRGQESHMIGRAAAADALVFVPRGEGALEAGAPARYLPLGGA
jgi:molybdopterin molybdotransferase